MALGGGIFLTQNKVLPGSYINFISAARSTATLSERGYCAMALELDWGIDGEVFTVESGDFQKESKKIFGYDYTSPKLKGLRDLFLNGRTLYCYRLNSGIKASNEFATAKCSGIKGNEISITINENVDDTSKFDVSTFFEGKEVDLQTIETAKDFIANDYIVFKSSATLKQTANSPLIGGTNGASVTGEQYQNFLDKIESYNFNTLGCLSTEETVKSLFVAFTKRLREEMGVKFQTVLYNKNADYEGIINVKNSILDEGEKESSLIYWVTGASAGCDVNKTNTNKVYDGEFNVLAEYKQSILETSIKQGEFVFHKVGDNVRVLEDINSFISATVDKNEDFSSNQVVRVLDQIGNDIAVLFNTRYLGKVQNNKDGRISLWNDIVTYCKELEVMGAIEDVISENILVEAGKEKKSVVVECPITPVCAMSKLYMTVIVQ